MSGEAGLIIEDADLFPPQNVTQGGMKLYGSRPAPMVIGYANAVVQTAGSGLVPLFEQMMHDQNGRRYTVDSFRRYESGGLGATIRGDVVLMGSIAFMKLMRVRVPEGTRLKQAVYLSVNGELTAVFALNYAPAESVRAGLASVLRAGALVPVLATRDFMITPQYGPGRESMCGAYCLFAGTSCILVDRNLERRRNMDLEHLIELILPPIIGVLEMMGIFVVAVSAVRAFAEYLGNTFLHRHYALQFELADGLATGLEFKMAAEILKTVLVREMSELLILGAVIILRALLSLLIHFELKSSQTRTEEKP